MTLYLIAGEPSGDRLGASLMAALRRLRPQMRFAGLGGTGMRGEGLEPLFNTAELAVMGIAEVVPRLPALLRRIDQTAEDVARLRPDALLTIDSPSFSLRVAEKARRAVPGLRTMHYVAPSVWAWRPGRAAHMARFVDHVLALLPFEPPWMERAGMTCDFVGHPAVEAPAPGGDAMARWREGGEAPLLLLAPGSRGGEVTRLLPLFAEVVRRLPGPRPRVLVPLVETVAGDVRRLAVAHRLDARFIEPDAGEEAKRAAFAAADAALVASGTVTLEVAAAGTPMVAAYRANWVTAEIVRQLATVETANLVNLVAGRAVVPEFLQERASPDAIAAALAPLLAGRAAAKAQRAAFGSVLDALGRGGEAPSTRAARSVLRAMGDHEAVG